jgi:hypothetical protein
MIDLCRHQGHVQSRNDVFNRMRQGVIVERAGVVLPGEMQSDRVPIRTIDPKRSGIAEETDGIRRCLRIGPTACGVGPVSKASASAYQVSKIANMRSGVGAVMPANTFQT